MARREFREVTYRCTNEKCGNEQTVRYFVDDTAMPATCCTSCRAGLGLEMSLAQMASRGIGMLPTRNVIVRDEPKARTLAEAISR